MQRKHEIVFEKASFDDESTSVEKVEGRQGQLAPTLLYNAQSQPKERCHVRKLSWGLWDTLSDNVSAFAGCAIRGGEEDMEKVRQALLSCVNSLATIPDASSVVLPGEEGVTLSRVSDVSRLQIWTKAVTWEGLDFLENEVVAN